jgi:hypothetical protein
MTQPVHSAANTPADVGCDCPERPTDDVVAAALGLNHIISGIII